MKNMGANVSLRFKLQASMEVRKLILNIAPITEYVFHGRDRSDSHQDR